MDRLDSPVPQLRPYLKSVLGCIILHIVIGAPLENQKDYDSDAILTMGMQDISPPISRLIQWRGINVLSTLIRTLRVVVLSGTLVSYTDVVSRSW